MRLSQEIFKSIYLNDLNGLKTTFVKYNLHTWNVMDKRGLAPIHYAAYRGSVEIVSWLVTQGSKVDYKKHECQNSPLHLAASKGHVEVCSLLLGFGAPKHVINHIDRTAAQMAADNGHFHCATIINNYVHKEEVRYYTVPEFTGSEPKLPPALFELFYKFVMMTNIHPVKVVFVLPPVFLVNDNALKIVNVLRLMSKRQFYKKEETISTKEMLAFKFHYLATIILEITKPNDCASKKQTDPKDVFLQKISKSNTYLEQFIHECIVQFAFKDSTLFRKMVSCLTQGMDSMLPLDVILTLVGNKRVQSVESADTQTCAACEEMNALKKCPKCKTVQYCNQECLQIHSVMHKKKCKQIRKDNEALKSSNETSALAKCLSKLGIK